MENEDGGKNTNNRKKNVHEVYIHITHTGNIAVELVAKICKYIII